jgi:hypothetical protein
MDKRLPADSFRRLAVPGLKLLMERNVYVVIIAIALISLWITGGALSKSYLIGRLSNPMTHNDVNYLISGIRRLLYIEINGFWAEIPHLLHEHLHAPLSTYQAALGFFLFGFHDWAPYASNIVYLWIVFAFSAVLLRGRPTAVIIAALVALAGMPLLYSSISEFAPEIPCGLFTALGVVLTLRISLFDRALGLRALAGLCFGLGLLAKPSSFAFMPLVLCATLGITFIRDVLLAGRLREFPESFANGLIQLGLSLWLPALYLIPNFRDYLDYFKLAMLDPANVRKFAGRTDFTYYFSGEAGQYMFGDFLWAYVATIAAGLAAASFRDDRQFIRRQVEIFLIVVFMWVLATVPESKNTLFGVPFAFLIVFMFVMAFGSIYETLGNVGGVAAVSLLGLLFFVSGTSFTILANTPGFDWYNPGAHVIREKWPEAMARFRAVMLGNSPDYHGRSVYPTNSAYYFGPVLWYFFLKKDPTLDWTFTDGLWGDTDPRDHIDFIHRMRADFVIAGERDNGLTYGPTLYAGASAAENAVLAALRDDPHYMTLDEFYGPTGRTITVFQRRDAFAGWRPLGGLMQQSARQPWFSSGSISHLGAYAPVAINAELDLTAHGPPGDTGNIIVNQDRVAQLIFDGSGKASLAQPISLRAGDNDIILRYSSDAQLTFERLLIVRKFNESR